MKSWLILLSGFLIWTVHFFGLYAVAEIAPHAGWVIGLTFVCVAANLLALYCLAQQRADEHFSAWRRFIAGGGIGLSLLAVVWQSLPALAV